MSETQQTNVTKIKEQIVEQNPKNDSIVSYEEYEIYSYLLKREGSAEIKVFIANKTTDGITRDYSNFDEVFDAVKGFTRFPIPNEVLNDYRLKNQESDEIFDKFNLKSEYKVGNGKDFSREQYGVIFGFSRVGFNEKKDLGLVFYEYYSGPKTAGGVFAILEKKNGNWQVVSEYTPWVS